MTDLGILNERYRPQTINEILGNEHLKSKLKQFIEQESMPHCLFHSIKPGTGKSSTAKILANELSNDCLYINASDENSRDTVRNKIKRFCTTMTLEDFKILVLDEFDQFTRAGQTTLRNVMEEYYDNTRFILTANYLRKIIDPIQSRCQVFEFRGAKKKDIAKRLCTILRNEHIKYEKNQIVDIINAHYPDIRRMINSIQRLSVENDIGQMVLTDIESLDERRYELLDCVKEHKIDKIREMLGKQGWVLEDIYTFFYNNVERFHEEHDLDKQSQRDIEGMILLTICNYMNSHPQAVNKNINVVALCQEISDILKEM